MYGVYDPTLAAMEEREKNVFIACYAIYLSDGNTIKKQIIKKETLKLYLAAVEELTGVATQGRSYNPKVSSFQSNKPPVSDVISSVIKEHGKWDKVMKKREPISPAMLDEFRRWATSDGVDSFPEALVDWLIIGFQAGFRKSEWLHDDSRPTEYGTPFHLNRDGTSKSFMASDFSLMAYQDPATKHKDSDKEIEPNYLRIKWRYQKNSDNGQMISFAGNKSKDNCVVRAARRILARAKRLGVPSHYPIAVFGCKGKPVYMTGRMVQEAFRKCAQIVYNIIDEDFLSRYTCHAVRVAAAVTLHCGGASDHTIMMRLRWKSGAFRGYLRNAPKLAAEHNRIVNNTDMDDMGICDEDHNSHAL